MKSQGSTSSGIRGRYEALGVAGYYRSQGANYRNPHLADVHHLIRENSHKWGRKILDLATGAGEAAILLSSLGHDVTACDPYTEEAFLAALEAHDMEIKGRGGGQPAKQIPFLPLSFVDLIARNPFEEDQFDTVVCSFALHLADEKNELRPLVAQLMAIAKRIVVITPHKRPRLEDLAAMWVDIEDRVVSRKGDRAKKVTLTSYVRKGSLENGPWQGPDDPDDDDML